MLYLNLHLTFCLTYQRHFFILSLFKKGGFSVNPESIRSYLKFRIFGRDQGEAENQSAGILKYVEDLIRGLNTDIERKDFFEMASRHTGRQITI